jgi:hypothetical protein
MTEARPALPDGVADRDADVWEPLIALADAAGSEWPERAREAAEAFVFEAGRSTPSLGLRLLADLRRVFAQQQGMHTTDILDALCDLAGGNRLAVQAVECKTNGRG